MEGPLLRKKPHPALIARECHAGAANRTTSLRLGLTERTPVNKAYATKSVDDQDEAKVEAMVRCDSRLEEETL